MAALAWERTKDPDDIVDYLLNWAPHLAGDTIISSQWIVPSGITKDSDSITAGFIIEGTPIPNTATRVWLSSGVVGNTYEFVNRIVTAGARTLDQTVKLKLRNR